MCDVLKLPRSTYYYEANPPNKMDSKLTESVMEIFKTSRNTYGTRRIKKELSKKNHQISRHRIGRIMKENGLISVYTKLQYKPHKSKCNESDTKNILARQFTTQQPLAAIVSDLTYVRVDRSWHYICILLDLYNREIIGYSAGVNKDAKLVKKAFAKVERDLREIQLFHTDRGNEFKNQLIDEALKAFDINRSLSMKGCPYDNAVAEATFKTIKTEFIHEYHFNNMDELEIKLADYVHWYNHWRIHSTLDYLTPIEYRESQKLTTTHDGKDFYS